MQLDRWIDGNRIQVVDLNEAIVDEGAAASRVDEHSRGNAERRDRSRENQLPRRKPGISCASVCDIVRAAQNGSGFYCAAEAFPGSIEMVARATDFGALVGAADLAALADAFRFGQSTDLCPAPPQ